MNETTMDLPTSLTRLAAEVYSSFAALKPFRRRRTDFLRQLAGFYYGDATGSKETYVNLIDMADVIISSHLAANSPRVLVSTISDDLRGAAVRVGLAINRTLVDVNFEQLAQRIVRDAFYGIGVSKIGLAEGAEVEIDGRVIDNGELFIDTIDLEDWVHDMNARRPDPGAMRFLGHRYRMPLEIARNFPAFNPELRARLVADDPGPGGRDDSEDARSLSQSDRMDESDRLVPMTSLFEIFLPHYQLLVTFADNADEAGSFSGTDQDALWVRPWNGPAAGPYRLLSFSDLPSNAMPVPPCAHWRALHGLANSLFRKMARQAERTKTITGVPKTEQKAGDDILHAEDGDMITVDAPDRIKQFTTGGVEPRTAALFLQVKDLFGWSAGNLDLLGGLGPQSDTATQDSLLNRNASQRIRKMTRCVTAWARGAIRDLAWYLWYDPLIDLPLNYRIGEANIPMRFNAAARKGRFLDYNFEIVPFSMAEQSPEQIVQQLQGIVQQVLMPMAPLMAQQGIAINVQGLLNVFARYLGREAEFGEILSFMSPQQMELTVNTPGDAPAKASATSRTYTRVNRPGATTQGKDAAMMQMLAAQGGPGAQPAETSAMLRPTG